MNAQTPYKFLDIQGKQRVFRAREKLNQAGLVSHITQRAGGSEPLFLEDEDYLVMMGLIKDASQKFDLKCFALSLMQNHVHILLQTTRDNLSQAMHSIFFRYGMRFNRKYSRRGHVFGSAYRQAVCLDNDYLLAASVYIHLNPVRAGLVDKAPDYRWSSCKLYCRENPPESFIDPDFILSMMDPDPALARQYYAALLHKGGDVRLDNVLEQETAIERFVSKLADLFPWLFRKKTDKDQAINREDNHLLEQTRLDEMIREVQIWKPRAAETIKARKYLVEQLLARGYKKTEIAARLGVSRKTVYNILNA